MSSTLDDELRAALRAYTADVAAPPGLLDAVRRGGARRRLRTRMAVAAAPVAVVAAVAAGTVALPRLTYSPPSPDAAAAGLSAADRALLARPTRGDLARDAAFRTAVRAAWDSSHRRSVNADRGIFDHPAGPSTVVWAGTTPAGRAAVVVQVFDLRRHPNVQLDHAGPALLWGFIGPGTDGNPVVVADAYPVPGAPDVEGALIGAHRQVLLVADRGRPADVSFARTYTADGYARRDWRPLRFTDGVAVLAVPDTTATGQVRLRPRGDYAEVGNQPSVLESQGSPALGYRLPWEDTSGYQAWPVGADPAAAWPGGLPTGQSAAEAFARDLADRTPETWPDVQMSTYSSWYAVGTTADGSRLIAGELQLDADPSRVYVVLHSPTGHVAAAARQPDPASEVPVMVPLPRGQGWLVAAKSARLSWRTRSGPWTDAGTDAALLPAAATEVRAGDGTPTQLR